MQRAKTVTTADLEHEVEELSQKFRVVSISHPNDSCAVILYETRGNRATGDVETRA